MYFLRGFEVLKFFQVSAFTDRVFGGNPAGVCLLKNSWPADLLLQNIAMQINLSETVFVLDKAGEFFIRWFTPTVEVDLCGHATLAAAHVLFGKLGSENLVFKSSKYSLPVKKQNNLILLDFPAAELVKLALGDVPNCFGKLAKEVWTGHDEYLLVYENEDDVKNAVCDLELAKNIQKSGFIITARSNEAGVDFVSRYFGPKIGIDEDPVTGSAHTLLVPYWQQVMGKDEFRARQVSKRGGELFLKAKGDRVEIAGEAVTFLEGTICVREILT